MDGVRPVSEVLAEVERLLADVTRRDLASELVDAAIPELALQAGRVARLAEAACVLSAGQVDAARTFTDDGARSASHWLWWRHGLPPERGRVLVTCARQLRAMPAVEAAFREGRIGTDQVRVLAYAHAKSPEAFTADEDRLVQRAEVMLFTSFQRTIRYWVHVNAPERSEEDAEALHQQRRVHASRTIESAVVVDALLDPVTGEVFLRELERLTQAEYEADWTEARNRLGDDASAADLCRTPAQRRADALRVMAERSAAKPADATEARPLIHVIAGTDTMKQVCELSNGTVLTPGQLLPLLRWADVARVIFDGPSRVIDIGTRQRLFTGATRVAIERRDQVCQHPSCDIPAERCEIDHIVPFEHGGLTTQHNGRALCPFHHRWRHRPPGPAA